MIWGTNFAPAIMTKILKAFADVVPKLNDKGKLCAVLQYIDDFLILGDETAVNNTLSLLKE